MRREHSSGGAQIDLLDRFCLTPLDGCVHQCLRNALLLASMRIRYKELLQGDLPIAYVNDSYRADNIVAVHGHPEIAVAALKCAGDVHQIRLFFARNPDAEFNLLNRQDQSFDCVLKIGAERFDYHGVHCNHDLAPLSGRAYCRSYV